MDLHFTLIEGNGIHISATLQDHAKLHNAFKDIGSKKMMAGEIVY